MCPTCFEASLFDFVELLCSKTSSHISKFILRQVVVVVVAMSSSWSCLRNGPATARESDAWVGRFWHLLEEAGQTPLLLKNLERYVVLTTDYSGWGS